jgi:hypothetical protein
MKTIQKRNWAILNSSGTISAESGNLRNVQTFYQVKRPSGTLHEGFTQLRREYTVLLYENVNHVIKE